MIAETIRWLLLPGIFIAAWYSSKRHRDGSRKAARIFLAVAAVLLLGLALTGCLRRDDYFADIHRRTGHILIIVVWLGIPFAMGVLLQQYARYRPAAAVFQLLVLLFVLGGINLAAFTGCLGPSYVDAIGEETRNRFNILHLYFLPVLAFSSLVELWWFFSYKTMILVPST